MLVSVIITTYKRPLSIVKRSIDSVLNQDYPDIEIIVVDDSPQSYKEYKNIKKYCLKHNIIYIKHEKNKGACAARNTGILNAKGIYISFLDDDDQYDEHHVSKYIKKFEANTDIQLVYANSRIIKNNKCVKKTFFDNNKQHKGMAYKYILFSNFIGSTSMVMVKRSVFDVVGLFDIDMPAFQDWEMWIRICKYFKIDYIDEPLLNYYIYNGERITNNQKKRLDALHRLNTINSKELEANKQLFISRLHYAMRLYIIDHNVKSAIKCYKKILSLQPLNLFDNLFKLKAFIRLFTTNLNA